MEVYPDISVVGIEEHKYNLKDIHTVIMCDLGTGICKKAHTVQLLAYCLDNGETRPLCGVLAFMSQCNC